MPLLIDQNISAKLATRLADLHPGSQSVAFLKLDVADDAAVWAHAKTNGLSILTRDDDFVNLSMLYGQPPKVIQVGIGNCTTDQIESLLRWRADSVQRFLDDPDLACLVLA